MKLRKLNIDTIINKQGDKKVLFIFPHPDDETLATGALIWSLVNKKDYEVHVISTTAGEKGDEVIKTTEEKLAVIRRLEYGKAMAKLGVKHHSVWNFADGGMKNQKSNIKNQISKYLEANAIDLVVTYERTGLYCHPDHVVLSKIMYELNLETGIKVLYNTLPMHVVYKIKDHMVGLELESYTINEPAEYHFLHIPGIIRKYLASKVYKSQKFNHSGPLWLGLIFTKGEYYTLQYESKSVSQ